MISDKAFQKNTKGNIEFRIVDPKKHFMIPEIRWQISILEIFSDMIPQRKARTLWKIGGEADHGKTLAILVQRMVEPTVTRTNLRTRESTGQAVAHGKVS